MSPTGAKTILIVDNDPTVITALSTRLESLGYRCRGAACGAQALALFQQEGADLVISDLQMPNGDGTTLATCLRRRAAVPIILISGVKDAYRRTLRNVPDVTFLHKPFATSDLLILVEAALGGPTRETLAA